MGADASAGRDRIAVFAGPTATILNSATLQVNEPPVLRPQRLAAPAVVYVKAFSGHPLERDASELYAPPDGYVDQGGVFHTVDEDPPEGAEPVYKTTLDPDGGVYLLPYVARPKTGGCWASATTAAALAEDYAAEELRQTHYPDAARVYEEIDRLGLDVDGRCGLLTELADFVHLRAIPPGGFRTSEAAFGAGLTAPERNGRDYFGYTPVPCRAEPGPDALVRATNLVQSTLTEDPGVVGAQWLEGSPTVEESLYWLNLLIDTDRPIVGHAAQRPHGTLGSDGGRNIVDGARYIVSRVWQGEDGGDTVGAVLIADQRIFASREVAKTDARPGNYEAVGGHGGVLGSTGGAFGGPVLSFRPTRRHTRYSDLRLTVLPEIVGGTRIDPAGGRRRVEVRVKAGVRQLAAGCVPAVRIVKFGRYASPCCPGGEVAEWVAHASTSHPLAGVVGEGQSPYGWLDPAAERALREAAFSGMPVVKCGRGNTGGFASQQAPWFVQGSNLTSSKARLLLMASMLKLGSLPVAADPAAPTVVELEATAAAVQEYQALFDSH